MQSKKAKSNKTMVQELKSQLGVMLNYLQSESISLNLTFILFYILLIIIKPTAARLKVFAAVVVCIAISYSPLYHALNNVQYYSVLAFVYLITCFSVTNKKVSATCCIMAIFEFSMVVDRYINAGIETWLYTYFEEITIVIHGLIISSFFKWEFERWWSMVGSAVDHMRCILRNMRDTTRLCYDYVIK